MKINILNDLDPMLNSFQFTIIILKNIVQSIEFRSTGKKTAKPNSNSSAKT